MKQKYHFIFSLIILIPLIIFTVSASTDDLQRPAIDVNMREGTFLNNQTGAFSTMNSLITLLENVGFDISYGEDGRTIFSMVDESLTRIISSLSSGNVEGFMDLPLIRETLTHFGLSADDIVIDPNDSPERMEAVDNFNRKLRDGIVP